MTERRRSQFSTTSSPSHVTLNKICLLSVRSPSLFQPRAKPMTRAEAEDLVKVVLEWCAAQGYIHGDEIPGQISIGPEIETQGWVFEIRALPPLFKVDGKTE